MIVRTYDTVADFWAHAPVPPPIPAQADAHVQLRRLVLQAYDTFENYYQSRHWSWLQNANSRLPAGQAQSMEE